MYTCHDSSDTGTPIVIVYRSTENVTVNKQLQMDTSEKVSVPLKGRKYNT